MWCLESVQYSRVWFCLLANCCLIECARKTVISIASIGCLCSCKIWILITERECSLTLICRPFHFARFKILNVSASTLCFTQQRMDVRRVTTITWGRHAETTTKSSLADTDNQNKAWANKPNVLVSSFHHHKSMHVRSIRLNCLFNYWYISHIFTRIRPQLLCVRTNKRKYHNGTDNNNIIRMWKIKALLVRREGML